MSNMVLKTIQSQNDRYSPDLFGEGKGKNCLGFVDFRHLPFINVAWVILAGPFDQSISILSLRVMVV